MEFIPQRKPGYDSPRSVVMLDGRDISPVCFRAEEYDDGTLIASIYRRTQDGGYVVVGDKVATSEISGKGSITPR
jgi:hypothetical protein